MVHVEKVKHTITIKPDLLKELKLLAVKKDMRYGEAIEESICDYLQKHKQKK
jgi:hypothetical protein